MSKMVHVLSDGPSYSTLCRVAFGAMSVPSGNAACERIFSELNDLLTKKRNRTQELSIDSVMCHHQWLLEGGKFKLHISFPLTDVYIAAGFDAFAAYKAQALKQQLENAEKERV